jgi:predicted amidohydrolase
LRKYQDLAKECGICIVPGTIVESHRESEKEEDKLLNVCYFIGKEGELLGKYVKKNLWYVEVFFYILCAIMRFLVWSITFTGIMRCDADNTIRGPERDHLTSSTHDPHEVFSTPVGPVGMLICWDLAFPEAFRELIAAGAKIIIIPTFWTLNDCNAAGLARNPASEALFLDSMLTARAFENTCAVVFANAGGPPGKGYAGLSQVSRHCCL